MRVIPIFLLAIYAALLSPLVSAMTLGEGIIGSQIGEHFSASIVLLGDYDKNVKFSQVRGAECRASIIGKTENTCDSLYEGQLVLSIKRRPDGQYFLRVTGERGDELFYRIIIKTQLPGGGTVYKAFDFLPEFNPNQDPASIESAEDAATIDRSMPGDGVIMGKIVEAAPEDASREKPMPLVKESIEPLPFKLPIAETPDKIKPAIKQKRARLAISVEGKPAVRKPANGRLQIARRDEHSDDAFMLPRENEEIERQISLLEKQVDLLKEIARLKNQFGVSSMPEATVAQGTPVVTQAVSVITPAVTAPVSAQAHSVPPDSIAGLLKWVLLALLSSTLLLLLYRRQYRTNLASENNMVFKQAKDDKLSLDLTGSYEI